MSRVCNLTPLSRSDVYLFEWIDAKTRICHYFHDKEDILWRSVIILAPWSWVSASITTCVTYVSSSCQQCCHFTVTSDILIETASAMTTIGIGPFFTYGTYKRGLIISVLFFVFVSSMNAKVFYWGQPILTEPDLAWISGTADNDYNIKQCNAGSDLSSVCKRIERRFEIHNLKMCWLRILTWELNLEIHANLHESWTF